MTMAEAMASAAAILFSPIGMGCLMLGVLAGIFFGAVPGVSGVTAMTVLLPFVVKLDPAVGMLVFIGILAAVHVGDVIPAILFSVPGTAVAMATIVDGYPMAKKGQAARAFGAYYMSSLIGGLAGAVFMLAAIPVVRPLVLIMGSPELLMLGLAGLSVVSVLSGKHPLIGIVLGLLGLLLGQIGMHPQTGAIRWSFGQPYLLDRLPPIPAILGLFGLAEVTDLAIKGTSLTTTMQRLGKDFWEGVRDSFRHWFLVLRCSAIGLWIGIVPGVGAQTAAWVAYGHAAQTSKNRDGFGQGEVRGVIAPGAANNASLGGDLLPTLAFAVPGSSAMVLVLAAFMMMGIAPGPQIFNDHLDMVYTIVWGIVAGHIVGTLICMAFTVPIAKLIQMPARILAPIVMMLCFIGAQQLNRNMWDLYLLLSFGVVGYVMKQLNWARPPLVLGLVLGPTVERYLFVSNASFGAAWLLRPGVIIIGLFIVASMVYGALGQKKSKE